MRTLAHAESCTQMSIAALLTIVKNGDNPNIYRLMSG
jgi:hypothetical protein